MLELVCGVRFQERCGARRMTGIGWKAVVALQASSLS